LINARDMQRSRLLHEFAGEWVIEVPYSGLIEDHYMMNNWQQTRIVFSEDGTCEVHNLTLGMTDYTYFYKQRPEWTGRKLTGTWDAATFGFGQLLHFKGEGFVSEYNAAGIMISWDADDASTKELPDCPPFRVLVIWKIKEGGEETYRLRIWGGGSESVLDADGIILKRVE
jgi:hypothetical protein